VVTLSKKLQSGEWTRGNLMAGECPSREVMKHVTSRWGMLILIVLEQNKTLRFSEIRRKIGGISERMLTQSLQLLEKDGFVNRVAFQVVPPHVEYSLTEMGCEVAAHVRVLADWIEVKFPKISEQWDRHTQVESEITRK
jgi:DNA-binding HxlR family transcriptional regulator